MKLTYRRHEPRDKTLYSPDVEHFGICRTYNTVTSSGFASVGYRVFFRNDDEEYMMLLKLKRMHMEEYFTHEESRSLTYSRDDTIDPSYNALNLKVCGIPKENLKKFERKINALGNRLRIEAGDTFIYMHLRS